MIGRDDEIRRSIQILSRRTKNNPCLIGEPGVGKTAVVEGLAQRIVNNDVPQALQVPRDGPCSSFALRQGSKLKGCLCHLNRLAQYAAEMMRLSRDEVSAVVLCLGAVCTSGEYSLAGSVVTSSHQLLRSVGVTTCHADGIYLVTGQDDLGAGHGRADRGRQVPWRVRGSPQGGHQRGKLPCNGLPSRLFSRGGSMRISIEAGRLMS